MQEVQVCRRQTFQKVLRVYRAAGTLPTRPPEPGFQLAFGHGGGRLFTCFLTRQHFFCLENIISSKNCCSVSLFCIREHWKSQDEVLPCSFVPICHSNCLLFNCPKASDQKLCEQSWWNWLRWPSMAKYSWKSCDKIRFKEYLSLL